MAQSDIDVKKFVHELQALLSLSRCTTLILTNPAGRPSYPAHTMVDGVFELRDDKVGLRAVRRLSVLKLRGSKHLRGQHVFDISDQGITVYPRLECLPLPVHDGADERRLATGITQLDVMLGGGVASRTMTLVLGPTGSGKTLLGLKFLGAGADRGEPGLYVGFGETTERLDRAAKSVRIDLAGHLKKGTLELNSLVAPELEVDAVIGQIVTAAQTRRVRRLFIDGLNELKLAAADPHRVSAMVIALTAQLRALGVTTMLSEDTADLFSPTIVQPSPRVASRADNVLFLRYVEVRSQLHRLISIVKERGSPCDRAIREFVIDDGGIEVAATFDSAEAVLSGLPRFPNEAPPRGPRLKPKPRGKGGARRRT